MSIDVSRNGRQGPLVYPALNQQGGGGSELLEQVRCHCSVLAFDLAFDSGQD